MALIEFDGIYGESDHWLHEDEVAAADQEAQLVRDSLRPVGADEITDLDQRRARRRRYS